VTGRIPNAAAAIKDKENTLMRSDLIFGALAHVRNRYELCQLAAKATRKLHKPTTRLQDTANDVLVRFHDSNPMNRFRTLPWKSRKRRFSTAALHKRGFAALRQSAV
jgi:hypothetical protein